MPSPSRSSINSSISRIPSLSSSSSSRSGTPSPSLSGYAISLAATVVSFSPHTNPGVLITALYLLLFIAVLTGSMVSTAVLEPEYEPMSCTSTQLFPASVLSCHWNARGEAAVADASNTSFLPCEDTTFNGWDIEVIGPPNSWKSNTPFSSESKSGVLL